MHVATDDHRGNSFLLHLDYLSACYLKTLFFDRGEVSIVKYFVSISCLFFFGISRGNVNPFNKLPSSAV